MDTDELIAELRNAAECDEPGLLEILPETFASAADALARAVREATDWRQRAEAAEAEVKRLRGAAGVMCDLLRTAIGVVDSLADEESEDPDEMRMYRARLVAAVEMWDLLARPADGEKQ